MAVGHVQGQTAPVGAVRQASGTGGSAPATAGGIANQALGDRVPTQHGNGLELKPQARALLQGTPAEFQQLVTGTDPELLAAIQQQVNGKTSAMGGMITIDNRQALIDGRTHGQDTYKAVQGQVAGDHRLNDQQKQRFGQMLEFLHKMQPEQRSNVFKALDAQMVS